MADEQIRPEEGNGKVQAPLMVQIVVNPATGQMSVNSNVQDRRMIINLLTSGIQAVNNSKDEQPSIIIPQTRIKL